MYRNPALTELDSQFDQVIRNYGGQATGDPELDALHGAFDDVQDDEEDEELDSETAEKLTADDRDTWLPTMQHIALEGRTFVLTACQHITRGAYPEDHESALGDDPATVMMRGGSAIIDPLTGAVSTPSATATASSAS